MRILAISKRQYMSKDLLDDRYGRFREIPLALARRGHEVRGLCISYRPRMNMQAVDTDLRSGASVSWDSVNLGKLLAPGLVRFLRKGRQLVRDFRPDIIWAGSDSFYGPIALYLGKHSGSRVVFDIYDHFETFASTKIPGLFALYRRACRDADGVTSFSEVMSRHIVQQYGRHGPLLTLVNGTDRDVFRPLDKFRCRGRFDLPESGQLLGIAGAISQHRGIKTVFRAFETLAGTDPDIHLVIAGPRDRDLAIPAHARLHDLGMLDHADVPCMLNALDIGIVPQRDSPAGRFGFPYKAYEMMACGLPLVAARVGVMSGLLDDCPGCLYEPDNSTDLCRAIRCQLDAPRTTTKVVPDWDDIAGVFEGFLLDLANPDSRTG